MCVLFVLVVYEQVGLCLVCYDWYSCYGCLSGLCYWFACCYVLLLLFVAIAYGWLLLLLLLCCLCPFLGCVSMGLLVLVVCCLLLFCAVVLCCVFSLFCVLRDWLQQQTAQKFND